MRTINTKSVSMYQLEQVPSEAQIKKYLRRILFGKNVYCPECKFRQTMRYENRYRCKRCRIKFTLLSHTWLSSMKLSYQKFWLVLWCFCEQIPVRQAVSLTDLGEEAVYRWYRRFRLNLPENQVILERIVQLDEAFFKNIAIMMGKQKGTRKLAYEIFMDRSKNSVDKKDVFNFLKQYVKPRSLLRTDGGGHYRAIHKWWPVRHKYEVHSKFEFEYTSEIEGMFGVLRTFIRRMYHHATPEYLPEYVSEFCLRFSSPEIFFSPLDYMEKTLKLTR